MLTCEFDIKVQEISIDSIELTSIKGNKVIPKMYSGPYKKHLLTDILESVSYLDSI